jgi:hypothetical protein
VRVDQGHHGANTTGEIYFSITGFVNDTYVEVFGTKLFGTIFSRSKSSDMMEWNGTVELVRRKEKIRLVLAFLIVADIFLLGKS